MNGGLPELDSYCQKILVTLAIVGEKTRFNKLHEILEKSGVDLSKPTLSQHLKHLAREELVVRKVEDVQNVSYRINTDRVRGFQETVRTSVAFYKTLVVEEGLFESLPINDQLDIVKRVMIWRTLRELKTQILLELHPERSFGKAMELRLLASPTFRHHERWVIQQCQRDKEYREKVIQMIDRAINELTDTSRK